MPYTPFTIERFGGLQLADDPGQVPVDQALDAFNTDPSVRGVLRARPGSDILTALAGGQPITAMLPWQWYSGAQHLVVAQNTAGVKVIDSTLSVLLSNVDRATSMVAWGQPGDARVYYSKGTLEVGRITDVPAFGTVATAPLATVVGVTPADNRLVTGHEDTVSFSDEGDPESWDVNNYVALDPGDGEYITDIVTYGSQMMVFKQSKFYVFYDTTIAGAGTPVFNYRKVQGVQAGAAEVVQAGRRAVAARGGVYILGTDGIYLTSGGPPVKISAPLDAWFNDELGPFSANVPAANADRYGLSADSQRLYFSVEGGAFVLDFDTGQWAVWAFPVDDENSPPRAAMSAEVFSTAAAWVATGSEIRRITPSLAGDDVTGLGSASPVPFSYRTGSSDLGMTDEKTVRQIEAWGSGAPSVAVYADHAVTDPGESTVTLGTGDIAEGIQSFSRVGTYFSVGIEGSGAGGHTFEGDTVHRLVLGIRERRLAGTY